MTAKRIFISVTWTDANGDERAWVDDRGKVVSTNHDAAAHLLACVDRMIEEGIDLTEVTLHISGSGRGFLT